MAARKLPNILVIVLDAVRAENFSLLGYSKPTTPNLERYADRLARYPHAVSAATWTLPSSTSLFTGVYTSKHGLVLEGDRLSPRYLTMAEILKDAGYFTAKVTGLVPYVSDFTDLDRGFKHSFEPPPPRLRRMWRSLKRRGGSARANGAAVKGGALPKRIDGEAIGIDQGLDLQAELMMHSGQGAKAKLRYWMTGYYDAGAADCFNHAARLWEEHADRPRFVYMHLQETHAEYRPPHRYRWKFIDPKYRGRSLSAINQRPNPHAVGMVKMSDDDYAMLTGLYDGCIAYLDEQIGRLFDRLAQRPDFDDTLIIVTSDHGDCIGRHGVLGHQFVCYDELVHIPLAIKWPKSVGIVGEQTDLVQNVDILPTLCAILGLETPDQCEGVNFLEHPRDVAVSELIKPFGASAIRQGLHELAPQYLRAVLAFRNRRHKLITYSNDQPDEFFNLERDPRESRNLLDEAHHALAEEDRQAHDQLRRSLEAWRPRWRQAADEVHSRLFGGDQAEISPEVEARLRALGYID